MTAEVSKLLRLYRALAGKRRQLAVLEGRVRWHREEVARLEGAIEALEQAKDEPEGGMRR